jgi:phospholipid-binding lipoprotein MlaA
MGYKASMLRAAPLLAALLLATPAGAAGLEHDPLEGVNRRVHALNREVQARVLAPAVTAFRTWTTPELRQGLGQAVSNLNEPVVAATALAAGRTETAWNAAARFGINTTLGWGGVQDRAAEMGYPRQAFGLGDTLCAWGIPAGPFLVLPVLGPATLRDATAAIATSAALSQALGADVVTGWNATDAFLGYERVEGTLRQIGEQALDDYAAFRALHLQRRAAACAVDRAALEAAEAE